jgi:hypothetical protein
MLTFAALGSPLEGVAPFEVVEFEVDVVGDEVGDGVLVLVVNGPSTAAITITEDVPQQSVLLFPQQKSVSEPGHSVISALELKSFSRVNKKEQRGFMEGR